MAGLSCTTTYKTIVVEYKTGTLEEYLPGVEKHLEEKAMQMGKKLSVTADLQSKKMQVAGEKKKETLPPCLCKGD